MQESKRSPNSSFVLKTSDGTVVRCLYVNNIPKTEGNVEEENLEEENVEEENLVDQDAPILKLNEDCFLLILGYIPFKERYVLSHVCRQWRNLMTDYWSRITELNFDVEPFCQVGFSERGLELYLRLCPNITSVHINNKQTIYSFSEIPTSKSIIKAATLCPQMKELTITEIELVGRPLAVVAHCCENLTSLSLKACTFNKRNNELSTVLKKCSNLTSLRLSECSLVFEHWLNYLPKGLKHLSLCYCEMDIKCFNAGLKNIKESLEELVLVGTMPSDPFGFKQHDGFHFLHSLVYNNKINEKQEGFVDTFKNLKVLDLEFNFFLSDDLLKGIVDHSSRLTALNISSLSKSRVTTAGYKAIAGLKELVKLNISNNNIKNEVLIELVEHCHNLEVLEANLCNDISDEGCKRVVQKLVKLQELHIKFCSKVTNKTVQAAVEAASQNPEKAKLTIFSFDTGIEEVEEQPHPLVSLNLNSDLNGASELSRQDVDLFLNDYFSDDDYDDLIDIYDDEQDDYDDFDIDGMYDSDSDYLEYNLDHLHFI